MKRELKEICTIRNRKVIWRTDGGLNIAVDPWSPTDDFGALHGRQPQEPAQ